MWTLTCNSEACRTEGRAEIWNQNYKPRFVVSVCLGLSRFLYHSVCVSCLGQDWTSNLCFFAFVHLSSLSAQSLLLFSVFFWALKIAFRAVSFCFDPVLMCFRKLFFLCKFNYLSCRIFYFVRGSLFCVESSSLF